MSIPKVSDFLPNNNLAHTPLTQIVRGGVDLGSSIYGRDYQNWVVFYENSTIKVKKETGAVEFSLEVANVKYLSMAFDTAMRITLAWIVDADAYLYYYDTISLSYITVKHPNVTSSRLSLDKADDWFEAASDVIFLYIRNNVLYYRQQRERYEVERAIGPAIGIITNAGLNIENRFQIKVSEITQVDDPNIIIPISLLGKSTTVVGDTHVFFGSSKVPIDLLGKSNI